MLNLFPGLIIFQILAPTLLRLAAAGVFLYSAYAVHKHRKEASHLNLPVVGVLSWAGSITAFAYTVIGLMLLCGAYTQLAALLGIASAAKGLFLGKHFGTLFPFSRSTYILLLVICLSLMLSGAGAFALDIQQL